MWSAASGSAVFVATPACSAIEDAGQRSPPADVCRVSRLCSVSRRARRNLRHSDFSFDPFAGLDPFAARDPSLALLSAAVCYRSLAHMDSLDVTFVCGIIFVGSLVRSTLGFGEALIAMPLLAFVIPTPMAAPLVAVISSFNAILILCREWRQISFRETGPLTIAALMGIPVGIWLLTAGSEASIKLLLAVVVITFSAWSLCSRGAVRIISARWAPVFGVVAGILGGAYNTAGPPLVIFGTLRQWPAERFRANLQSYFLLGGTTVLTIHISRGSVNSDVLRLTALCVPLTIVAALIGHRLTKSVSTTQFIRVVHVCLLLIGTLLLVTAAADFF